MGQSTSMYESSSQDISNSITQISNENCINSCTVANNKTTLIMQNTTANGNVNTTNACFISGASCILKASLSSSLINSQSSTQTASESGGGGLFGMFDDLATIGSSDNINENNYQSISNNVTQSINSTCQNPSEVSNNDVTQYYDGDTINGDINITNLGSNTKSQCVLNNMVKSYVSNSQANAQTITIKKGGCGSIGGGILGIFIIIIAFKLLTHDSDKQQPTSPTATGKSPTATGKSPTATGKSPTATGKSPTATTGSPKTAETQV